MSDIWDKRYAQFEAAFGTDPNDFLASVWQHIRRDGGPVVCIGDGQGRNGVFLAEQGFDVISVDLSVIGIEHATRLAAERGVMLTGVLADLADWQPPHECAAIVSIFCHLPSEVRARAYPRLTGALAVDGVWIMESYTPDQIGRGTGGPPVVDMMHDAASIAAELTGPGALETVVLHELVRPVVEGPLHTGDAAVVQYVGRRRHEVAS